MNQSENSPKLKPYTIDDVMSIKDSMDPSDIYTLIQLIDNATEQEITNIFSNGIDEDIKRRMDMSDLSAISHDIECLGGTNLPELSRVAFSHIMIDLFINIFEKKFGEGINWGDFYDIKGIYDLINIIKPSKQYRKQQSNETKIKDIGANPLITAIRNGLMHDRYIFEKDGIYIHSPKAWTKTTEKKDINGNNIVEEQDFEALIQLKFFISIIEFCINHERRYTMSGLNTSTVERNKGFDYNKNKIKIEIIKGQKKGDINLSVGEFMLPTVSKDVFKKDLTIGQKEFLSEYFKTHEFNHRNINFIQKFLFYDDNRLQFHLVSTLLYPKSNNSILSEQLLAGKKLFLDMGKESKLLDTFLNWFTKGDNINDWKIWWSDEDIESEVHRKLGIMAANPRDIFDIYKNLEAKKYCDSNKFVTLDKILPSNMATIIANYVKQIKLEFMTIKDMESSKKEYLKNYLKVLFLSKFYINNPKLKLAQPQKRTGYNLQKQGYDYIMNKCKNNPKSYWSKDAKEKHIDQTLGRPFRERLFKNLTIGKMIDKWIIKDTEDINKIMDKINSFITKSTKLLPADHKQILVDNVKNVIKDWKETLDNTTIIGEEEHIRNAFAHHNYTIVPGFTKILLQDPSRDDNPDWEKIYDLDELYENCVNNAKKCFLDKTS